MDVGRGNSIPEEEKDYQNQSPWIPVTPVRPILPRPQPIYAERQNNQLGNGNWAESVGFPTGFSRENEAQRNVGSLDTRNSVEPNRGVDCWEAAAKSNNGGMYGKGYIDPMAGWNNIRFVDLLTQAALGSTRTKSDAIPTKIPIVSGFSFHVGGGQPEFISGNPSPAHQNEAEQGSQDTCSPQVTHCELSIPGEHTYDLNALPATMVDELPLGTNSQFAPITPDNARRLRSESLLEIPNLCLDERKDQEKAGVEVDGPHSEKLPSQADSSFPVVFGPLEENHNPDKGNQAIDLNKTPQQKPRRKKHRPKVVIEGTPKRTRKPATSKPNASKENPTVKRKYVRKKGVNNPSTTPPPQVAAEISDPKSLQPATKSARRALNFDEDGQARNERFSCGSASNLNLESQGEQLRDIKVQSNSTVQINEEVEVMVENTGMGIAYELNHSINQSLKDYISLPTGQAPSTSPPTNIDCPHSQTNTESPDARLKANAQNEDHMEGIGRMIDDNNQCRSKQIFLKSDNLASPRSPNDSNCSTNANLTEEQAKGKKRVSTFVVDKTDPSAMNLNGAHHNSLQTQNKFKVNEFNNTFLKMHFPEIYKKRRTEKGQTSTASSTSSTVTTTAKNIVKATKEHFQNDSATPRGSKANLWISDTQFQRSGFPTTQGEEFQATQDELQAFECMLALRHTERLTKKRSKGPTRVRDLASLIGIAGSTLLLNFPEKQTRIHEDQGAEISQRPPNCIEALVAETRATLARRKRSKKRNPLINSVSSSTYVMQENQRNILSARHEFISKKIDTHPQLILENSVDAITEGLKHLDINKESETFPHQEYNALVPYNPGRTGPNLLVPCNMGNQEQNALVLYRRDGTLIPFDGSFNVIKRRRPRPKVDLDEETTKVWKLLLENINNEGIDGTDEEKARWWEEERRVFRGRADSFIARMHLVQGDRRFSPWKGSVVDSVVGVFLTQNVSDHLSSSAYMSLAARFPLKPKSDQQSCYEEGTKIIVEEPEVCILDSEENLIWKEKMPDNLVCDQSSMTLYDSEHNEEKEVVNSNESSGSNTGGLSSSDDFKSKLVSSEIDLTNFHVSTSQTLETETACMVGDRRSIEDVISSQSSVDSSITQSAERIGPCPESNSRTKDPAREPNSNNIDGSTSFLKLLQMAGDPSFCEGHNQGSHLIPSDKNLKEHDQPAGMGYDEQRQSLVRLDSPKSSQETSIVPPRDHCSNLTPNSELQEVECINLLEEDSKSCDISDKKDENSLSDKIRSIEETSSKATLQSNLTVSSQESQQFPYVCIQSMNISQRIEIDLSQSERVGEPTTGESLSQGKNGEAWQNLNLPNLSGEILDVTESTSVVNNQKNIEHKGAESNSKERDQSAMAVTKTSTDLGAKRRRVAKEKNTPFDWDSLRKQAQANGRKRERTANTMDSLDWEAIRCADVSEIAETIKERGMNNMLAERIKDFLNRLVREHGSIDLEWLRDVPPDRAKEYLLSIRGLGLKSVECVRLLTLHHLAFPVDTNVGRIAVRLGWVPLQPLPESLQLHLLELYPVLESIQKYLWPRLCRLDQRTLYELHYQMITFGKVFCTKSKPNCNACPMRGECRHFASAFASARLALPGPEEKSIVSATENRAADHNPDVITTPLPLPLPPANQQSGEKSLLEAKSGISNSEPIIEEPATPEPERIQVPESDIEDTCCEDPDEIPTIKLNIEEFTQNLQNYMQENMELQDGDVSKALVALTSEAASIPMQKLKNVSRLRTEHQVYELPDSHPLLKGLDNREPDDPCSYLLAIWTPGETANSIQPPEQKCNSQEEGYLCSEMTCFSCNSIREANSQIVRGTLLIPCRTAMRGSFPLNGTYFQVNEVFADHDSSLNPIDVPRAWIWNLPRRTVYFGTSIPTIFKGLTTEGIQYCFWRGFVCVRGFDQKTRAPRPLMARLHFPASKLAKTKAKTNDN